MTAKISKGLLLGLTATVAAVLLLLGSVGSVSPVFAVPPDREPVPLEPFVFDPQPCDFPVLLEPLTNKEKITIFYDQEGNIRVQIVTGGLKVRLTNLDTGKSLDLNISGPYKFKPQPDGSTDVINYGPTLFNFFPGVAPGFPRLALFHGQTLLQVNATGDVFTFVYAKGKVQDLCPLLSGS